MGKRGWLVGAAMAVMGCSGASSGALDPTAPDAVTTGDSGVDKAADISPAADGGAGAQVSDAATDSGAARQDKDADISVDSAVAVDAGEPEFYPGSPTSSTGCAVMDGDPSCCATVVGDCVCGASWLVTECERDNSPALTSASSCYEIQRAWATGACANREPEASAAFACTEDSQCAGECGTAYPGCCTAQHTCGCLGLTGPEACVN